LNDTAYLTGYLDFAFTTSIDPNFLPIKSIPDH